eukprot:2873819-Pyramimonas_sp.AAC.1
MRLDPGRGPGAAFDLAVFAESCSNIVFSSATGGACPGRPGRLHTDFPPHGCELSSPKSGMSLYKRNVQK